MWCGRVACAFLWVSFCVLAIGCSKNTTFVAKQEPWRDQSERACLTSGYVRESSNLMARAGLGAPSQCGAIRPFRMFATRDGQVRLNPPALLRCPMIPAVEQWVATVVRPAALHFFGQPAIDLKVAASYACRPINHVSGGKLSEHGHANALDVSGFKLADGRWVMVKSGWRGSSQEAGFLQAVHQGACRMFTTVLGPNADRFHHDHFHLDLAMRRSGSYCK